jgi:hypothetical protein
VKKYGNFYAKTRVADTGSGMRKKSGSGMRKNSDPGSRNEHPDLIFENLVSVLWVKNT